METVTQHTFLYDFLVSPKYRIGRHFLLILSLAIIAFNQTFFIYQENIPALGSYIYLLGCGLFLGYVAGAYFTVYVLIPRYLLQRQYTAFIVYLSVLIVGMLSIKLLGEYVAYHYLDIPHSRSSYFNYVMLLDNVSYYITMLVCIAGMAMTVLLKNWIIEDRQVSQLQKKQIRLEVEQLKDQVNPNLLFNVLNRTGVLAKSDPKRASEMILKLSHLLRYQLYDGNRKKVLLSAEIKFLDNYLALEKLYSDHFDYTISSGNETNRAFVPPLLFIPFVQEAVKEIHHRKERTAIEIRFQLLDNHIEFLCICYLTDEIDFTRIRHRLELLYANQYKLSVDKDSHNPQKSQIRLQVSTHHDSYDR